MDKLENEYYWFLNLLIAAGIAKRYGVSVPAAVRRCARRMRTNTISQKSYDTATLILGATDSKITELMAVLNKQLESENIL